MVQLAIGRRGGCLFGSPEILPLYSGSGDFRGVKPPDFPVFVDSGPSQSPRPIRHEQSAQFAMSRSPEYHEQHSRSGTAHAQQRNDAHERCYA